ncbi:Holliday junction branch migration protein RuvA [Demequina capsici]|uniref:Holliday junction branch migration complex subunit RuvA n=1 Tax=Demequina capsici TaxID=3075620 RepID=A0AA96FAI6_9MICO|nr:Holliday junction branch migration protein RuvA [Demequina sp. OYTSA14]WNM25750.1 Holliday junction branch migration protein RuvA [Demequina sp. OYTSA14]
MIAQLTGTVAHVGASAAVLDVSGVGYRVLSTPAALAELRTGQHATLHTHLVVREESLTLYGFAAASERDTFETLQSVQGVGPKLALAMLAVHSPQALVTAVQAADRKALEKVPGIGAKVAARLLLELGGRLSLPEQDGSAPRGDGRDQVVEALVGLGYNAKAAQAAVEKVASSPIQDPEVADTLRAALKALGGSRG